MFGSLELRNLIDLLNLGNLTIWEFLCSGNLSSWNMNHEAATINNRLMIELFDYIVCVPISPTKVG